MDTLKKILQWLGLIILGALISIFLDVWFHETFQEVKWWLVSWVNPSIVTFEATGRAGCTTVTPLLASAEKKGLSFDPEMRHVRLCDNRRFQGPARRILEDLAAVYHGCFTIDENGKMSVRNFAPQICKINLAIDQRTNDWIKSNDATVFCFPDARTIPGQIATEGIPARLCPDVLLREIGVPVK
jgi:hypothetical protein